MVKQLVKKIFQIKSLKLRIFILVTLFIGSLAIFQYEIQTKTIKDMFQPQLSSNPEATEYFINAMGVAAYIERLHNFVNYDSFLMKPLLNKMNTDYEKGKSLLPENSAEDVFWYMLLYRKIYGIGVKTSNNDISLDYEKKLKTEEEYKKYYEDILYKITRLGTLEFKYDTSLITDNKLQIMNNLLTEYLSLVNSFIDNYLEKKQSKLILDKKYLEDINSIYLNYNEYIKKNTNLSNKKQLIENKYFKIIFLTYISIIDGNQTHRINCENPKYQELFKNIKDMKKLHLDLKVQDNSKIKYIFEKSFWLNNLLKTLTNCSNLKEEINEILPYFEN
ncbi:hypothetical protein [Arcobacter sp. L]|uniref:hypothetical protein n=1 Tax=Arcobacter sp. L TaxID=944547 RepID=UPI0002295E47|nr:hypothetical protein [Arcobacter sp. L]BAK72749.1 conserved hypothetical protein [Arcobacter sp. L]